MDAQSWRAGGGSPPWGRQSAARPVACGGGENGVSDCRIDGAQAIIAEEFCHIYWLFFVSFSLLGLRGAS